ncbi:hypothetical protein D3C86_1828550 [compost metagenome]
MNCQLRCFWRGARGGLEGGMGSVSLAGQTDSDLRGAAQTQLFVEHHMQGDTLQ